jgi:hypothetical protein
MNEAPGNVTPTASGPRARTRDHSGGDAGYGQVRTLGRSFTEPGVGDPGINNSTPVDGDSCGIVGW